MMVVGLLICVIGIIPIVLAISSRRIFNGTELSFGLLIYMTLITFWQTQIGLLYFKGFLNESLVLFLFRLFRFAPTFSIPIVFYIALLLIQNNTISFEKHNRFLKFLTKIFSKKVLYGLCIWSTFVYILSWTNYGIKGLKTLKFSHSDIYYYFPDYGPYNWVFLFHLSNFIFLFLFIYIVSNSLENNYMKEFLRNFATYSILLYVTGFINFSPESGALLSSLGVVIFSVMVMFSFLKLNLSITLNYNRLIERQKKLDYTGNLVGSLIHEVKNNVQIIKGFNQLLATSKSLTNQEKDMFNLISRATQQIEFLSDNYSEYIKFSKIHFKTEDLNEIIQESIDLSQEILKKNNVNITFKNKYNHLNAYVNKAYLQQVFFNLIKNSSEAISPEHIEREILIETEIKNENIHIHIKDTGKGIQISEWENVFNPFVSSKNNGMGMGLPFIRKIIFEHRGEIKIINSTSKGTHFEIKIPQNQFSDLIM